MPNNFSFKAEDRALTSVLYDNNIKFRIPRYQRSYSWATDQVEEFWHDVMADEALFVGSMIFNYEHQESDDFIDVIDGQQRLLTVTIFNAVIRDAMHPLDFEWAERIQRQDIAMEQWSGGMDYRIRCGDSTHTFFRKYIQEQGNDLSNVTGKMTAEEGRVKRNYEILATKLSADLDTLPNNEDKVKRLNEIRKRLRNLVVIHVRIDSEEEAFEIFETTNARGVDLSVGDLVKNVILKKLSGDGDGAKVKWDEMIEDVAEANVDLKRFLRYHWISKNKSCSAKNLFREMKKETTDWGRLLDDVNKDGRIICQLATNTSLEWINTGFDPEVAYSLENIRKLGFTVSFPFLMRLIDGYQRLGQKARNVVKTIENVTFLYNAIGEGRVSSCESIYCRHAVMLNDALKEPVDKERHIEVAKVFSSLEKDLIALISSWEVFKEKFMERMVYRPRNKVRNHLVRYVLVKINTAMESTRENQINERQVNIEHVLPQDPADHWGLSKKEVANYVNKIGNLTLVDKRLNSSAGNEGFDRKLEVLSQSKISMTQGLVIDLIQAETWNEDLINVRQEDLAKYAWSNVWSISRPNQ